MPRCRGCQRRSSTQRSSAGIAVCTGAVSQRSMRRSNQLGLGLCRSSFEHIIGVSVSAMKPDTTTAPASASANSTNSRPVRPGVKASGAYTATSVSVIVTTAKPISRAPRIAGRERVHALLDVAEDVLQHHDGVVHHQADRQHQRQQRQRVDGEAEQRHQGEGADQADRDRDDRDDRGAHRAQEHEDHQRHQQDRFARWSCRRS